MPEPDPAPRVRLRVPGARDPEHEEAPMPSEPPYRASYTLVPIGRVRSPLVDRTAAPKQGHEGGPDAWLDFDPRFEEGLSDLRPGDEVLVLTWLHEADRDVLSVHPRDVASAPLRGVFGTRSSDRPNPIGIHRVRILAIEGPTRVKVSDLEAIDGTPIVDVKPVIDRARER
jgi:tRNA-Thr(GGU) m(6)t(6)A37 methyltransferase TsaA